MPEQFHALTMAELPLSAKYWADKHQGLNSIPVIHTNKTVPSVGKQKQAEP